MSSMTSKITGVSSVYKIVFSPGADKNNQNNIKAPRHWPLCAESPVTDEFPVQRASTAENDDVIILKQ